MRTTNRLAAMLAVLLAICGFGVARGLASAFAGQDQPAQSSSAKKPATKKSEKKELSDDQGGARGFQLPGETDEAKPPAKTGAKRSAKRQTEKSKTTPKSTKKPAN